MKVIICASVKDRTDAVEQSWKCKSKLDVVCTFVHVYMVRAYAHDLQLCLYAYVVNRWGRHAKLWAIRLSRPWPHPYGGRRKGWPLPGHTDVCCCHCCCCFYFRERTGGTVST